MIWHSNIIPDVLAELRVDPTTGLTEQEAAYRLKEYGKNSLQEQKSLSLGRAFIKQLRSPDTILLLAISGLVLILNLYTHWLKEIPTPWPIPLIVAALAVVAALLTARRQCRAASASVSLKSLSAPDTLVRRNGIEQVCSAQSLVPGDIILLKVGHIVPADCRLIEVDGLRCDEHTLLGTTMPTDKYADAIFDDITPLSERTNMLYAGTIITAGTATAVVVATGVRSEMGNSHKRQPHAHPSSSVPAYVTRLSIWWSVSVACVSLLSLIIALLCRSDDSAVLLITATMAAAAFPDGITALYTHLTAHGIHRIHRRGIRVHHPDAVDTLGKVTVMCIDEGMLRQDGDAELCRAFVGHRIVDMTTDAPKAPGLGQLMRLTALNSDDNAVLTHLQQMGIDKDELLLDMPRIGELPLTDERKTVVHLAGEQTLILVSGNWRSLLPLCTKGNVEELTAAATAMERDGLQVRAVTYRLTDTAPSVYTAEILEQDLTCVGLLGLRIPLRSDAPQTESDVRILLFSDESPAIAVATARNAGLTATPYVATGEAIANLSDADLADALRHYNVYCGLDIAQKQRILTLLQQQGEVVAVTTTDSEEAALLSAADVGIALGSTATDVAKAAAALTLTDDDPSAIFNAVCEGRRLRWEKNVLFVYLLICSTTLLLLGGLGLTGLVALSVGTLLLMGLHLLLLALPTPVWVTLGISHIVYKLREKQ